MNASIVAMSGWIMPAPLAMPVTVTSAPSMRMRRDAPFGTVSVVMIARAAACQRSSRAARRADGSPSTIFPTGNGSMMTPVENTSTCSGAQPTSAAAFAHVARASASPELPVPALALPALTTSARKSSRRCRSAARCSRHTTTGAAQKRFCVKTPPAAVPGAASTKSTSSRSQSLIRAAAVPSAMPGTGSNESAVGGV